MDSLAPVWNVYYVDDDDDGRIRWRKTARARGRRLADERIIHRFWAEVLAAAEKRRVIVRVNEIRSATAQDARSLSEWDGQESSTMKSDFNKLGYNEVPLLK